MESQKPVAKFRAGAITCAVWENSITVNGQPEKILKATVSRRYRDRSGTWQTSQSFSRSEIPLAVFALQKAFELMLEQPKEGDGDEPLRVEEEVI